MVGDGTEPKDAAEIHELRTMMSAAGLMMQSIGLPRFTDRVDWGTQGAPPEQPILKPRQFLLLAEADLQAAHHHFEQAANSLTAARLKLSYLV